MSAKITQCEACKQSRTEMLCDGCGRPVDGPEQDDAVTLFVHLRGRSDPQHRMDYCAECARKKMPEAMGVTP